MCWDMVKAPFRLVCFLVIVTTFAVPICTMRWTSMWLEFHDWWLLFTWGHHVIFGEVGILGTINEPGFASINVIFLSILWIILSIVLLISYFIDTNKRQISARGFILVLIILMLQIVLPLVILQLAISPGLLISNITPIPTQSIVMVGIYIIHFVFMRKNGRGRKLDQ